MEKRRRKRKPKPERIPMREPDCMFYDRCLNEHAISDLKFACTGCGEYRKKELSSIQAISENQNHLHLLLAIFYPDAYARNFR